MVLIFFLFPKWQTILFEINLTSINHYKSRKKLKQASIRSQLECYQDSKNLKDQDHKKKRNPEK